MHQSLRCALGTALLSALSLSSAAAQRPLWIGLAGGASVPAGDLADRANVGWHGLGVIGLSSQMQPIGLRLDVAYNRLEASDAASASGQQNIGSATFNASYRFPSAGMPIAPYLIAGLGAYRLDCSGAVGCDAVTRFGWNAGLGTRLRVLGFGSFLEARFHRTKRAGAAVTFVPVTFGLMF